MVKRINYQTSLLKFAGFTEPDFIEPKLRNVMQQKLTF